MHEKIEYLRIQQKCKEILGDHEIRYAGLLDDFGIKGEGFCEKIPWLLKVTLVIVRS